MHSYKSGRVAVVTVCPQGAPNSALYSYVYADDPQRRLLAYFNPNGNACCYYDDRRTEGAIHLLVLLTEATLFDTEGKMVMTWKWEEGRRRLSAPINVQVSVYNSAPP